MKKSVSIMKMKIVGIGIIVICVLSACSVVPTANVPAGEATLGAMDETELIVELGTFIDIQEDIAVYETVNGEVYHIDIGYIQQEDGNRLFNIGDKAWMELYQRKLISEGIYSTTPEQIFISNQWDLPISRE